MKKIKLDVILDPFFVEYQLYVADDVTLIANNPHDLQTMLNIQMDHANKHRYIISDQKSCKHNVHGL